jgi:hypothetical protein
MEYWRRQSNQNYVRLEGESLSLCANGRLAVERLNNIVRIEWVPGSGSPLMSATAEHPELQVRTQSGTIYTVELGFATRWAEFKARRKLWDVLRASGLWHLHGFVATRLRLAG